MFNKHLILFVTFQYINLSPTKNQLVQKWLDSQCTELFIPQYSEILMDQPNNEFTVTPESNLETSGIMPIVEIKKVIIYVFILIVPFITIGNSLNLINNFIYLF